MFDAHSSFGNVDLEVGTGLILKASFKHFLSFSFMIVLNNFLKGNFLGRSGENGDFLNYITSVLKFSL